MIMAAFLGMAFLLGAAAGALTLAAVLGAFALRRLEREGDR